MSELYDIFFSAQLIDDFDEAAVRKNMAQLFKANEAALGKLFSGKPQLIKRGVNKAAAIKYKAAMQKAGAVARIRKHAQAGEPAPAAAPKPTAQVPKEENLPSSSDIATASTPAESGAEKPPAKKQSERQAALDKQPAGMTFGEEMSVAPAGSDVLREDEREQHVELDIDTSGIQLASSFTETETPAVDVPPAPDTSHLSMGEVGEDIPQLESTQKAVAPDTSHLSMGEVGEDIPNLDEEVEIVEPDISGIDLAPEGSDMLEEKDRHKDEVEAPNTDHLSLKD
jgi:hypothetical protein